MFVEDRFSLWLGSHLNLLLKHFPGTNSSGSVNPFCVETSRREAIQRVLQAVEGCLQQLEKTAILVGGHLSGLPMSPNMIGL